MKAERVQEYYEMLKYYYLKPDSDWSDKAKSMRTVAHDFYQEITRTYGNFADARKEFYKWNKYNDVHRSAISLKEKLNEIVHQNRVIDKATYVLYYSMLVRLIYLATEVVPDEATMEFIGCSSSDELKGLTDEQKEAVLCDAQIIYVSAGPGTGKTHLLINKLLHYISSSTTPEKIVALSYTNTAANELGSRFHRFAFECGVTKPYEFYNGTLHAFCFKMMKSYYNAQGQEFNYIVIDDNDIEDLAEEFRIQLNDLYKKDDIKACLRSRLRTNDPRLQQLVSELKARYNVISIEDILTLFIDKLGKSSFRSWFQNQVTVLVIDEAQDLSELNYRIFDLLLHVNPQMKVFLVGDPRQNIFGFNGGSYEHLDNFLRRHSDYAKKRITGTFRCPQPICNYVNTFSFIDCENVPLRSVGGTTGQVHVSGFNNVDSEALHVLGLVRSIGDLNNTAILCQNLKYLAPFIDQLVQAGIPYKVFGGQKIVKHNIKLFNHILRIIDSDNEYSIRSIDRAFALHLDRIAGRNIKERFFYTSEGRIVKEIKEDIERKARIKEDISMKALASTLIERFFDHVEPTMKEDFSALEEIMGQYNSIPDFLLAFAIERENFAQFIEKNYVECMVPTTDKYLTISTIHSAKGLEWSNVIIMGMSENNFPNTWFDRDKTLEEQKKSLNDAWKAMFVAATRTKGDLYLTYSTRNVYNYNMAPSRFLQSARQ